MKVVHISDLHLGKCGPGDAIGARRLQTLREAMDRCAEFDPVAVIVAGDVFDSPTPDKALIRMAARALGMAHNQHGESIPVVVIPGNHDPADSEFWDVFEGHATDSLVRVVRQPEMVSLCGGLLRIEAYPCTARYSPESPWATRLQLPPLPEGAVHVVLAHGTLKGGPVPDQDMDAYPFTLTQAESLEADYVALGHFHGVYPAWNGGDVVERGICYSGTHEQDQFGSDAGWAIIAELQAGQIPKLQRVHIGGTVWKLIEIRNPRDLGLLETLQAAVEADPNPKRFLVRVRLGTGLQLTGAESDRLELIETELRHLGVTVERAGEFQTVVDVESLELSSLPSGAVREALRGIQQDLNDEPDEARRELLRTALQIGWDTLSELR